jgi:hypothetical protein
MRLNCQFDLIESGQSPDGLGGLTSPPLPVSLIALAVLERGLGHSGARQPPHRKVIPLH